MELMFCASPFNELHILKDYCSTCCGSWLDHKVITASKDPWNSDEFCELRRSILDGSFKYCEDCPRLIKGVHDKKLPSYEICMDYPTKINVGNDVACNLYCWQCRGIQHLISDGDMSLVHRYLSNLSWLSLSHSGDPFFSTMHRSFLQNLDGSLYPNLKIELFTNGLLLPLYWDSLHKIHSNICHIRMSIDAATEQTYTKVRRGGNWADLMRALEFISNIVSKSGIRFTTNFCIQRSNIHEVFDFIELMQKYNATNIAFNLLRKRAWHSSEDYKNNIVVDTVELDRIINDVRMQHPKVFCAMVSKAGQAIIKKRDCNDSLA